MGKQQIERYGHGEWYVEYAPGEIYVEARNGGKVVCMDKRETTGKPVALKMVLDNKVSKANGKDFAIISCFCVDDNGREVPDAECYVRFHCNSLGEIVGTGSDITDHNPVYLPERRMRAGRITVAVRVGTTPGQLKVYAESENLEDGVLTIPLE